MHQTPRRALLAFAGLLTSVLIGCANPGSTGPVRVMAYNIRHGEGVDHVLDLQRTAGVIVDADPDVVALQEVDDRTARTESVDQTATLARLAGFDHHVFGPFMDYAGGRYGMAILSRHPIGATRIIELPPGRHEPRIALYAEVARSGGPFAIVGVHFDWLDDDSVRFEQARALVEALAGEMIPVVIAGDFNDVPGSRTIELLDARWARVPKAGNPLTFPSPQPDREIDFVYVKAPSGSLESSSRVIDEPMASDHRPVLAEIVFGR